MKTTFKARKGVRLAAAAGALSLLLAGVASADPVLQEGLQTPPAGMRGGEIGAVGDATGWRGPGGDLESGRPFVEFDVRGLAASPDQGTIELRLTRDEVFHREALFSLVDARDERLFAFRVYWDRVPEAPSISMFAANASGKEAPAYWYVEDPANPGAALGQIPLGIRPAKGESVHFAITWAPTGGDIFVNGRSLSVKTARGLPFSELVARADRLVVGAEFDSRIPRGAWSVAHSVISDVQVHDVALAAAALDKPIAEGAPLITEVSTDAFRLSGFSGRIVAGQRLGVTVLGTPGAVGTFDLVHFTEMDRTLKLDWRGYGVYLEEKRFFDKGEVNLRDVVEYRVYASTRPLGKVTPESEPVERLRPAQQTYTFENLDLDSPYYLGVYAAMRDGSLVPVISSREGFPLTETAPGEYSGSYTFGYGDRIAKAVVVGRLARGGGTASVVDTKVFKVDPSLTVAVTTDRQELMADEKSTAKVSVLVTDANGEAVPGHKIKFLLATTSEYTGVVGGGAFADEVGAAIQESTWAETDLFGRVTATYTAGFAAKTAIIVARDMVSNDTGTAAVKTYIQAFAELQLDPVETSLAAEGYEISVTSSDSWLTADGSSQARITATVTLRGEPVEGHAVDFQVSAGGGTIRTVSRTTDRSGRARAVYTAGKKIGVALVTATDTAVGVSGSVQIELRSDAPAKISLRVTPERLPADGSSRAELAVTVTDINDNPNEGTTVECRIEEGGGSLREENLVTDRRGEAATDYIAGRSSGRVRIGVTVRSSDPTEEELGMARDLAVAVTDYDFF